MSRWKASAIHLLISFVIAMIVGLLFLKIWYPPPFFEAAGADELMLILVGIDVAIGPLITLIIFRTGKPGLRFDLSVIAVIQCCSLLYGISVVLQSRPVFLVAAIDRFVLVSANELNTSSLQKAKAPEFRQLSWIGPKMIAAMLPTDPDKKSDLVEATVGSVGSGEDIERMPEFYVPYDQQAQVIVQHAKKIAVLRASHPEATEDIDTAVRQANLAESDLGFVPLVARKHDLSMIISMKTGATIQAISVDPW